MGMRIVISCELPPTISKKNETLAFSAPDSIQYETVTNASLKTDFFSCYEINSLLVESS